MEKNRQSPMQAALHGQALQPEPIEPPALVTTDGIDHGSEHIKFMLDYLIKEANRPPAPAEKRLKDAARELGIDATVSILRDQFGPNPIRAALARHVGRRKLPKGADALRYAIVLYFEGCKLDPVKKMREFLPDWGNKDRSLASIRKQIRIDKKVIEADPERVLICKDFADRWLQSRDGKDLVAHLRALSKRWTIRVASTKGEF